MLQGVYNPPRRHVWLRDWWAMISLLSICGGIAAVMGLSVGTLGTSQPVPRDSGALAPYFLRLRGGGWQNPVTQWLEAKPVFDEHWTLNGPHLINKRKNRKNRKKRFMQPHDLRKNSKFWTKPMYTEWGLVYSPNRPMWKPPPKWWLESYNYEQWGLPGWKTRGWFLVRPTVDYAMSRYSSIKPRKKRKLRRFHAIWRRIFNTMFRFEPGGHIRSDLDVPCSGIDRPDRFGNQINWDKIYNAFPFQETIMENKQKEVEFYHYARVKHALIKFRDWATFFAMAWWVTRRHPYRNDKKFVGRTVGHYLTAQEQMWAYKEGMLPMEELDFRKLTFVDFYNPRYDDLPRRGEVRKKSVRGVGDR
ncbi:hypothetical protein AAMO2058_000838900 [Amorphochlora amoebiformis]